MMLHDHVEERSGTVGLGSSVNGNCRAPLTEVWLVQRYRELGDLAILHTEL